MKSRIIALFAVLLLLLTGCSQESNGKVSMDGFFEKTPVSLEEGHFFFTGKVTATSTMKRMISFYEAEAEKSTFYQVEITDDPFQCMPARTVTVCILGSSDSFAERSSLKKGTEYLFDTSLWVQEEEAVFLLPTFYNSLVEREGDTLYLTTAEGRSVVEGTYAEYLERLISLAEENNYTAETVLNAAKDRLESAAERDEEYFKELKFERIDSKSLEKTTQTATALLKKLELTEKTWEGIRGLLK